MSISYVPKIGILERIVPTRWGFRGNTIVTPKHVPSAPLLLLLFTALRQSTKPCYLRRDVFADKSGHLLLEEDETCIPILAE